MSDEKTKALRGMDTSELCETLGGLRKRFDEFRGRL